MKTKGKKLTSLALVLVMILTLFPVVYAGEGDADVTPCETHDYINGVCTVCGAKETAGDDVPVRPQATISPEPTDEPTPTDEPAENAAPGIGLKAVIVPPVKTHSFVFHVDGQEYHTVILKDDETLSQPANPEKSGYRFSGWFSDEACTTEFTGFGQTAVMDDGTTDLYAKFEKVYYLRYLDQNGQTIRTDEAAENSSYSFRADDPPFNTGSRNLNNVGWKDQHNVEHRNGSNATVTVSEDLTLTPILQECWSVRFDTRGGSAVISQIVPPGGYAEKPDDPTHMGYSFDGWYDRAEGGNKFDFAGTAITADTVVYAHWTPQEVTYTVVLWLENADGASFSYGTSFTKTGYVGAAPAYTTSGSDTDTGRSEVRDVTTVNRNGVYKPIYFYLPDKTEESVQAVVDAGGILADGSTSLNVYYRRLIYNVIVKGVNAEGHYTGVSSDSLGVSFPGRFGEKTVDAAARAGVTLQDDALEHQSYTMDIAGGYSVQVNSADAYFGTSSLRRPVSSWPGTPDDGATYTFTLYNHPMGQYHFIRERYYETVESARQGTDHWAVSFDIGEGSNYDLASTSHLYMNSPINGVLEQSTNTFTLRRRRTDTIDPETMETLEYGTLVVINGGSTSQAEQCLPKIMRLFYSRNRFSLEPVSAYGIVFPMINGIPYEDTLGNYEDQIRDTNGNAYIPGETLIVDDDGITLRFVGWYSDPSFSGSALDLSAETMPGSNYTIYAKWEIVRHTVTFDPNGGTFSGQSSLSVPYGQQVPEPAENPTLDGSVFLGWTYNGKLWDFASPITGDLTLVALYTSDETLAVAYDPGAGSGTVTDSAVYLPDAKAVVQSDSPLTPPTGQHFVYWQDKNGGRYTPGSLLNVAQALAVDGVITLTAVYAPDETPTSLIYDLNYDHYSLVSPCGYDQRSETDLLNNSKITLQEPTAAEKPAGYSFGGWYLDADLGGSALTEVLIDRNDPQPNIVYARWTPDPDTPYRVEFYYEVDGAYPDTADESVDRSGTTDTEVSVTDEDKTPLREKYELDERYTDAFSGTIKGDGTLVLKVCFRRQYTIIYDPNGGKINGSTENVEEQHYYGDKIKIIAAPVRTNYRFLYWKGSQYQPGDSYTVTEDHTFVAQWKWKDPNIPSTGDESKLPLWSGVLALATLGLGAAAWGLLAPRKKKARRT